MPSTDRAPDPDSAPPDVEFDLTEDREGRLVLARSNAEPVVGVTLRRAFPWSNPSRHVSVRSPDGKELLLIDDVTALPQPVRGLIEAWLGRHRFVPRITRVHSIDMDFGYQQWRVETDRGPAEFRVQEREDVRFLHDGRFAVRDADGNIYELANLAELDRESRRALEALL